jgi:predicted signal transduction protein with EAL and GGDEF domain
VEQEEQKVILDRLGCDGMQGYLFSKPVSPEEIAMALGIAHQSTDASHKISPPSIRQTISRQPRSLSA